MHPLLAPRDVAETFVAAWNARDPDRLASLFDDDAEFVNVTGLWWHSREAIRRAHAYGLTRIFQASTLSILELREKALRDDVVVVHARMRLTGQTPAAGVAAPGARTTVFSFVVHRAEAGWRCASAHNTDVVAGMETHIRDSDGALRPVDYRREGEP